MSKLTIVVFSLLGLISACVGVTQSGQCDPNVPVHPNFMANDYAGTWYDIESLPSTFQTGTCNTARYTVTNTGLSIENTQVSPEGVLQTATGTASPQPGITAGIPKFDVLFTGNTVPAPYWVLDTDYTTFALVYSCRNVNALTREVLSWKLGRVQGPLPTAAITRINATIASVPALTAAAPQFVQRDHSAQACASFVELAGSCQTTYTGAANFDATSFVGTWYEFARYRNQFQTGQCNRATYGAAANGIITVQNTQVIGEALLTRSGVAFQVTGTSGVLQVNFDVDNEIRSQNLVVVATDNNNYALLYSCTDIAGNRRRVSSWQLRKSLTPLTPAQLAVISNAITTHPDLQAEPYVETSQTDAACFYYPVLVPPQATIELPGPCDTSITGAANFNAALFIGTWYEVERYPQPTQAGQCNRAIYGEGPGGSISIQNSQVTAEAYGSISGTAVPVPGQNGVVDVTLGTNPQQRLYVLATDNTNYALMYSCTNIEGNRRRVGSWKLSKQLQGLSAASNASIDAVIATTQGLRQDYYQPTHQTDAACFYYPVLDSLPATIELPGPCNGTVTGVANFNAESFLGTWYEIARYPQPTQTGQCNRAVYTVGTGNAINVQNSQVTTEALSTISGTATPVTNLPGTLDVVLTPSSGVPVEERIVVLATDYNNYALLYSCVNMPNNRRRVGSWQLTRQLGAMNAESAVAIGTTIEATQGLRQNYYQTTNQSDAACFYYPVFETLPATIELPGPCNTTITGAANFNAQTFVGTWYEVERYPQPTQAGQCNRAVYTAATGGITVQNSQVTAETLSTIPGTAVPVAGLTGVLDVTLTTSSGLVNQRLYVLATDNTNFALLYSCEDIAGNRRRVGSWKMSKQVGGLSAVAIATIDNSIANTQGLIQRYYQTTYQTDAMCFYYPATQSEEKVIIPGQCDTSISGQTNINMTRFANGTWYHIQRYDEVGNRSCIGTRLSYATTDTGHSITVNSVEVAGSVENRTQGTAQLIAAANGQFNLTWAGVEGGTLITVMETDYDGYAIAYTCDNSGNANRQVGVWLLSRQRTWPAAGATALGGLVNSRQEFTLRDGYFKVIPHNNDCPEPSSAFLFKSSIIVIFVCTILQFVW